MRIKIILIAAMLLLLSHINIFSQVSKNISVEGGLSIISIIGDNANTSTFAREFGGSFNGSQSGFGLRANYSLDDVNQFSMPIGFDYNFFTSSERYYQSEKLRITHTHEMNLPSATLGLQFAFLRFPNLGAKFYFGLESKFSLINQGVFTREVDYTEGEDFDDIQDYNTKESAFRIGGLARIGLESKIDGRWFINFSLASGILNLIGADDNRGELFTPFKESLPYVETKESPVYIFHVSMNIQYKL